jgi:hypothetical protein
MKWNFSSGTLVVLLLSALLVLIGANLASAMSNIIPIQGKLTNAGGNPLTGDYSIKATIYTAATAGTELCTDTKTVTATNGLFIMDMANCSSNDFSGVTQLYLGIQVGSDPEMTPRQPLYGTPFAWGLVNGVLSSGAPTYQFIPGSSLVKDQSGDLTRWDLSYGSSLIYSGSPAGGSRAIRFPLSIPSVLYGQQVRVTAITIYYNCQNAAQGYITSTTLYKNTDADSTVTLVSDLTDRNITTASSYFLNTNSLYNTLSSTQGVLTLLLSLNFSNDTSFVRITGIRLTLDTNF